MTPAQKIEAMLDKIQRDGVHMLVWADSVEVHCTLCKDRAGLDAYTRIHGGIAVHLFPHLPEPMVDREKGPAQVDDADGVGHVSPAP
mgnify:CR=1 FL=1